MNEREESRQDSGQIIIMSFGDPKKRSKVKDTCRERGERETLLCIPDAVQAHRMGRSMAC